MTVHLPSVKPRYEPCVYFARRAAAVKIGFSGQVATRVANLKAEVLGVVHGDESVERAIHAHFADLSLGGEWFIDHPAIRSFVAEHCPLPSDDLEYWYGLDLDAAAQLAGVTPDVVMRWVDDEGLPCSFTPAKRLPSFTVREVRLFLLMRHIRFAASNRDAMLDGLFGLVAS